MKTKVAPPNFDQTVSCVRCALCQTVCPVFQEYQSELVSPRSKVRLIREYMEGNLELTPRLKELLYQCLGCQKCSGNCPAKIPIDELILLAKEEFVRQNGFESGEKLLLRQMLGKRNWLMDTSFKLLRQFLGMPGNPARFLPRKLSHMISLVPELPAKRFHEQYQQKRDTGRKKVGYYVGCLTDQLFPQVPQAVIYILEKHGYQVVVPEKLGCCGTPQWSSGDIEGAMALSYQNLDAFHEAGVEVILTDCGSCGSALRKYEEIHQQGPRSKDFAAFSSKIQDVVYFIQQEGILAGKEAMNQKITYHDSCHVDQGLKITEEPRQLLANLPGIDYREMNGADQCCGGGGSFMVKYPETSNLILKRKIGNIKATDADSLVTSCPSCRIQLAAGLKQAGLNIPVIHPVELFALSFAKYRVPPEYCRIVISS